MISKDSKLDVAKIPEKLRHLIDLAQEWNIGDDIERDLAVENATSLQRRTLLLALCGLEREFDD